MAFLLVCGIIGYIGNSEATPILIDGLRRLEYRGYDSAGVATLANGEMELRKCAGRIASLTQMVQKDPPHGTTGIGHTRWATHGRVTDENAHPHLDESGKRALIHNGAIENFQQLRDQRKATVSVPLGPEFRGIGSFDGHIFERWPDRATNKICCVCSVQSRTRHTVLRSFTSTYRMWYLERDEVAP